MNAEREYLPALPSDADGAANPLFLQIARAIAGDIRGGRLASGTRLPGTRELAMRLGVHRNTVLSAYSELEREGWTVAEHARGTFVAAVLPEVRPRSFTRAERARPKPIDLPELTLEPMPIVPNGALPLLGGLPDLRLVPHAALARAYGRALRRTRSTLGYGSTRGDPRLIRALLAVLRSARGLMAEEDEIVITRGSTMALHLAARAVCRPGDCIAVEAFGYSPAWEGLKLAGAELVPVPVDRSGIQLEALSALARARQLRAVYVTPHHQYPTTVTMTAARRIALLGMAERLGFFVLEDDYDHEFHWSGRPVLPLASADPARVVLYVGTLSKVFAPGLRIGYLVARPEVVERAARLRTYLDRQGDHSIERALAELIEDGEIERHVRRVRRMYRDRRDALVECLHEQLAHCLSFELPAGGLALWARAETPDGVENWAKRALERGVMIQTARRFAFDRQPHEYLRLGFPALDPEEIRRAINLLASSLPARPVRIPQSKTDAQRIDPGRGTTVRPRARTGSPRARPNPLYR